MVQAVIRIEDRTNKVLNIVKAKYGLQDKSKAIDLIVTEYENFFLEPQLRPEYEKKIKNIVKEKHFSRKELDEAL